MRNFWYVSLSNDYPYLSVDDPVRVVQSVQIKKKYSIVEMTEKRHRKKLTNIIFDTADEGILVNRIFKKT